MKFEKPPLVELIAEFRWLPLDQLGKEVNPTTPFLQAGPTADAFYDTFRRYLGGIGYTMAERLVPANFPHVMYQPVYRYSREDESSSRTIYQSGPGLLSVHALPPYQSWDSFKPVISNGLDALISSRPEERKLTVFTAVNLRYIDAFDARFLGDKSQRQFLADVLQVNLSLPAALDERTADTNQTKIALQVSSRLKSGLDLTLSVGPNVVQGEPSRLVMDTAVSSPLSVECDRQTVMRVLETAHDSIRQLFIGMTQPIQELMVPLPEGS